MAPETGQPPWIRNKTQNGMYVSIETINYDKKAAALPVVMMKKFIEQYFPGTKEMTKTRDGRVIILTRDETVAQRAILNAKRFYEMCDIEVKPMDSMNSTTGTIFDRDLLTATVEEIRAELSIHKVTKVERIERKVGDQMVPSGLHIITFACRELPETVTAFFMRIRVQQYYPNPMRCIRCCKYGHTKNWCGSKEEYCKECGQLRHANTCEKKKCRNCPEDDAKNEHGSFDPKCPVRLDEIKIIRMKVDCGISLAMARKKFEDAKVKMTFAEATMQNDNETHDHLEQLALVKEQRLRAEEVLKELENETAMLKKLAADIVRKKKERDDLVEFIKRNTQSAPESVATTSKRGAPKQAPELIDMASESMDFEQTENRKRGIATSSEEETEAETSKHQSKKAMACEEEHVTAENFSELPKNMQKQVKSMLTKRKQLFSFWKKNGQLLYDIAKESEIDTAKLLFNHVFQDGQ
jgi:hypothetical protein